MSTTLRFMNGNLSPYIKGAVLCYCIEYNDTSLMCANIRAVVTME